MGEIKGIEKKKELLNNWLDLYKENYKITIASEGERVDKSIIKNQIVDYCSRFDDSSEYIYLLCLPRNNYLIPVYIGKSVSPVSRWTSHIGNLLKGKGSYQRWSELLLREQDIAIHTLNLILVPEHKLEPPIPNFPNTVGSVEYQLVSLVSDSYPDTLLNKEGNRR